MRFGSALVTLSRLRGALHQGFLCKILVEVALGSSREKWSREGSCCLVDQRKVLHVFVGVEQEAPLEAVDESDSGGSLHRDAFCVCLVQFGHDASDRPHIRREGPPGADHDLWGAVLPRVDDTALMPVIKQRDPSGRADLAHFSSYGCVMVRWV